MALKVEVKTCSVWFLIGSAISYLYLIVSCAPSLQLYPEYINIGFLVCYIAITHVLLLMVVCDPALKMVAVRGLSLGQAFGLGLIVALSGSNFALFGWYMCVLSFFHVSEYLATGITNPTEVSVSSFLLDHSPEYHIAMAASVLEFWLQWYFFTEYKQSSWLSCIGLCVVILGELLRKGAMYTASSNFNHYVQHKHRRGHELVTSGIYSFFRHPSYVGWFYWSVGTQLMMLNPLCCVAYTLASWRFFRDRIEYEEMTLISFFGEQYLQYQGRVPTGLPFIKGYVP